MAVASRPVRGSSWSALAPLPALTVEGAARRLGGYCWVEQRLFGLLGTWVGDIAEPDAKAMVAEHAEHAAWRAQRWYEVLPTAPPGADALVVPAPGVDDVFTSLGQIEGPERTVDKLSVAYRSLLVRLWTSYSAHLDWAEPVAEASTRRLLELTVADLGADLRHGQRLLEALVSAPDEARRLADVVAGVDAGFVASGGILGPGSVGERPPVPS